MKVKVEVLDQGDEAIGLYEENNAIEKKLGSLKYSR